MSTDLHKSYTAALRDAQASFSDAAIIGFTYAYMCNEADKGNDVRKIEVPRIYEAWKEATKSDI